MDGVFIDPHVLSCSLGIPENYQSPEFINTVDDIIKRVRDSGKGAGIHMIYEDIESEIQWLNKGASIDLYGADLISFKVNIGMVLSKLKKAMGDDLLKNKTQIINV